MYKNTIKHIDILFDSDILFIKEHLNYASTQGVFWVLELFIQRSTGLIQIVAILVLNPSCAGPEAVPKTPLGEYDQWGNAATESKKWRVEREDKGNRAKICGDP